MAATTMLLTMIWMMDLALRANPVTLPLPLLAMRPPVMGKGGSDVPAPAQPLRLGWDGSVGRTLGATLLHKTFSWTLNPFVSRRAVSETARENRGTSAEPSPARENAFSLFFFPFHPLQMFHTLSLLFSLSPTSKFAEAEWQLRNHGDDDGIFSISFHASASLFLSSFCHGFANFAFHRTVDRLVAVSSLEKW